MQANSAGNNMSMFEAQLVEQRLICKLLRFQKPNLTRTRKKIRKKKRDRKDTNE